MSADPHASGPAAGVSNPGRRFLILWLVLSAIATPLAAIFLAPAIPPGDGSVQSTQASQTNIALIVVITPVLMFVLVFVGFSLSHFRVRAGDAAVEGPPDRGDSRIQILWAVVTTTLVLGLAGFGSYVLAESGAGGGQGPSPAFAPANHAQAMNVQVIAQQWEFTYRYPSYGGLETPHLILPANTLIRLNVTSLDAVHSFWAYQLGVKADANPGVNNVVYVQLKGPESFDIRCAELCGLWHGYMFDTGEVVSHAQFLSWIKTEQHVFAPIRRYLPKYATSYLPQPVHRGG